MSADTVVVIAVTRAGASLAARLAPELHATAYVPTQFAAGAEGARAYAASALDEIRRHWAQADALVLIMAAGIAVRAIAPLLEDKRSDPAVLCLDEAGRFVVPLLGGHQAGANALARRIAALIGGQAAITTASDTQGLPALDQLGQAENWQIDPESALTHSMACLVNGAPLGCYVDPALPDLRRRIEDWLRACPNLSFVAAPEELLDERYSAALLATHRALDTLWPALRAKTVRYLVPLLVVGIGCRRAVPADELYDALGATLDDAGLDARCIAALATADLKANEPGLIALADMRGVPLEIVPSAHLAALDSAAFSLSAAWDVFDLPGVAEPSAVVVAGGPLLVPKRAFARCTVAVALKGSDEALMPTARAAAPSTAYRPPSTAVLSLIGLGPGDPRYLSIAARDALLAADVVTGYHVYIEQIRPLLSPTQELIVTRAMGDELGRARQAIELAAAGRRVALVSSGDIGIYAMAGPVFELLREAGWTGRAPEVEVLPGISAFQAAAARLGAPISHDFCVISLSDLLTPWALIERRIAAAATGDFVVAFYNPRSRERYWQLGAALDILRAHRPPATPVAFARNVSRPDERITLRTLADADPSEADMFTLVLVGNSRSYTLGTHMATPRGYEAKAGRRDEAAAVAHEPSAVHCAGAPAAQGYPITLTRLADAQVVVVGGGAVGERKVRGVLACGAALRLVSPEATPQLRAWAEAGHLTWLRRPYAPDDLEGARLVFAATNQRAVNALVARDAAAAGLLCNVADAPGAGDFHLPAVHRAHGLSIAVGTDGSDPARAAQVRDRIAAWLARDEL